MLKYPHIDPIALQVGPVAIRWYSLAYIAGILGGWLLIGKMNKRTKILSKEQYDSIMSWGIIGIILGGRIGYVLFYNFGYFLQHPSEILMVWQGGMSFHGGMLGLIIAMLWFSHIHKIKFLGLMDMVAATAPIGLFFGRVANFINGELYGRVTTSPLGMVFPDGGNLPRHASQLYEAALEGLLAFIILMLLFWVKQSWQKQGFISGIFLILYSLSRMFVECFREPDIQLGYFFEYITMGQILSLPMLLLGVYLVFNAKKTNHR